MPVTLYYNTSGTTGTVTLSESSSNFTYLEIYYGSSRESKVWHHCAKVFMYNGQRYFTLFNMVGAASNSNIVKASYGTGYINETSITRGANGNGEFEWHGTGDGGQGIVASNTVNDHTIYRVVGYR